MKRLKTYIDRKNSVITGQANLEHLYTFNDFPVFFGCTNNPEDDDLVADMVWEIDPLTGIIQLSKLIPLEILYMDQHFDATGETWDKYNDALSEYIANNSGGNILEIGGGSGKLAKLILKRKDGIVYTVVEPNPTFQEENNLKVIEAFFDKSLKEKVKNISTVVFSQLYEHVYDPEGFLNEISEFLPIGGKMAFGYPNLEYLFKNKFTNAINFEHTLLMTDYYVDYFLAKTGFVILDKTAYENHSHFYTVEKRGINKTELPVSKYSYYKEMFEDYISFHKELIRELNQKIKETEQPVYLFGAHIFSSYLISFGLDISNIVAVLDNSPLKQNKRLYGTSLQVFSPKVLKNVKAPIIILKAGLYNDEIKKDILDNINSNAKFV